MKTALSIGLCVLALILGTAAQQKKAAPKPPPDKTKVPELSADDLAKIEAALPVTATATPKSARKILVFWRCEGFFHGNGIAGGNKAIELMGAKTGAYTADIAREYEVFEAANLNKYDAVVLNNTTRLTLSDAQQKALLAFVRGGKGIVGIHAATDNFYEWPDGAMMMGGLFCGHPWGGGGTWAFKIDEPHHTLTKAFGGKGFKLKDEIYQFKEPYTRADRLVLLSLDLADEATGKVNIKAPRADNDYAVAWIKKEGKGRVFYNSLGHAANVFQEPAVLQFLLDGIQYALGDLAADASPK
ncbi:MAG: ThuA domain-containing protein [Verrucomicrobia bacterium]|nr:ThuA domain-containing protein [Verrucomicrobiota bacterium]